MRGIQYEFADFRLLIYGGVFMLMLLTRPEGLLPEKSRQRELCKAKEEETLSSPLAADQEIAREGAAG